MGRESDDQGKDSESQVTDMTNPLRPGIRRASTYDTYMIVRDNCLVEANGRYCRGQSIV